MIFYRPIHPLLEYDEARVDRAGLLELPGCSAASSHFLSPRLIFNQFLLGFSDGTMLCRRSSRFSFEYARETGQALLAYPSPCGLVSGCFAAKPGVKLKTEEFATNEEIPSW